MSMMVYFVLSFFPRDVLDEILNLIESVSEDFLTTLSYRMTLLVYKTYKQNTVFDLISAHFPISAQYDNV